MQIETAVALINGLIYKPDWRIEATDNSNRFQNSVVVKITYPCVNSDRDYARMGYPETEPADRILPDGREVKAGTPTIRWEGTAHASFIIMLDECPDDVALYYKLGEHIVRIECHEMREFLRVRSTLWSPFHPHRTDGIQRWAQMTGVPLEVGMHQDTTFGIA